MTTSTLSLAKAAANAMLEKKATEVTILKLGTLTSVCDYFVIANANSRVQAKALAQAVKDKFKQYKIYSRNQHGLEFGNWILMDFANIIVHIFLPEVREFYDLEGFWSKAKRIPFEQDEE